MRYTYKTTNTCSRLISFDIEENIVKNVEFVGGCPGNLQAISKLVEGMTVEEIERKLAGIRCGMKSTSCADQLVKAVKEAKANTK